MVAAKSGGCDFAAGASRAGVPGPLAALPPPRGAPYISRIASRKSARSSIPASRSSAASALAYRHASAARPAQTAVTASSTAPGGGDEPRVALQAGDHGVGNWPTPSSGGRSGRPSGSFAGRHIRHRGLARSCRASRGHVTRTPGPPRASAPSTFRRRRRQLARKGPRLPRVRRRPPDSRSRRRTPRQPHAHRRRPRHRALDFRGPILLRGSARLAFCLVVPPVRDVEARACTERRWHALRAECGAGRERCEVGKLEGFVKKARASSRHQQGPSAPTPSLTPLPHRGRRLQRTGDRSYCCSPTHTRCLHR